MYCERLIYKSQIQLLDKERILEAATFDRTKIRYVFFFHSTLLRIRDIRRFCLF